MLGKDFPSHDSSEYVYDSKLNFEEGYDYKQLDFQDITVPDPHIKK